MELWWSNYNLLHGRCTLLPSPSALMSFMCSWVVSGINCQRGNIICGGGHPQSDQDVAVWVYISAINFDWIAYVQLSVIMFHQDCLSRVIAQVFCCAILDHWGLHTHTTHRVLWVTCFQVGFLTKWYGISCWQQKMPNWKRRPSRANLSAHDQRGQVWVLAISFTEHVRHTHYIAQFLGLSFVLWRNV